MNLSNIDLSRPVWVYRNLSSRYNANTPKGEKLYSVMQNGLVRLRTTKVMLNQVNFYIRPSGRKRVAETGQRNVHAFAIGMLVEDSFGTDAEGKLAVQIKYNPKSDEGFVTTGYCPPMKVHYARGAILNRHGVTVTYFTGEHL